MAATEETSATGDLIASGEIRTLDITLDSVHNKYGFGMDYGGTVIKIAYALEVEGKIRLHFACYPRHRREEAFQHIKEKIGHKLQPGQEVVLTGVGVNQYRPIVEKELDVKCPAIFEFYLLVEAFQFLTKHFPVKEIILAVTPKVREYQKLFHQVKLYEGVSFYPVDHVKASDDEFDHDLIPEIVEYPALVFILGSCGIALLVHADGHFECIDNLNACGSALLGLGSLTANTKSYEELVTLAEKGSVNKVDVMFDQVIEKSENDGYGHLNVDTRIPVFPFGHVFRKTTDDCKKEDLAASVVAHVSNNIAVWSQLLSAKMKAKHAYFCGSYCCNSEYVRDEVHKIFSYRVSGDGIKTHAHFLKLGGYLGALGSLLRNLKVKDVS